MRDLILAVDGGQTSSKAIVATIDGDVLGTGSGSPCDHLVAANGYARNAAAIRSSSLAALRAAQRDARDVIAIGLGLTSAPRPPAARPVFEPMVAAFCDPDAIWVDADIVSNLAGASAGSPGIVVIAGGGSIGYGISDDGREAIADGLGYLLGDDGSGWWFGIEAIRAAARAQDRRGPPTVLLDIVQQQFSIDRLSDVKPVLYAGDFNRGRVSSMVPAIVDAARSGDHIANEIVRRGAVALADLALGVARQLDLVHGEIATYPTGGVFHAGEVLLTPFIAHLRADCPEMRTIAPRFPPVIGAWLLARREMSLETKPDVLRRLETSLPRAPDSSESVNHQR